AGDDVAFDGQARQRLGVGAGGQQDVLAAVPGAVDLDRVVGHELAPARDDVDLARLDEALQPLVHARNDAVLVGVDFRHVDALERPFDAEGLAGGNSVGDLCRTKERLCRDAPAVQAGATNEVTLHEGDAHIQLCSAQCGGVPPATGTQDNQVV